MGKFSSYPSGTPVATDEIMFSDDPTSPSCKMCTFTVAAEALIAALAHDYVKVSDVKAYNVAGGTFTQDAWQTRDINTEDSDTAGICSISSNQITLEAGTYECHISCLAYKVDKHTSRLRNITDGSTELLGTVENCDSGVTASNRSVIVGRFILAAQKVLEIQHYCTDTQSSNGFGTSMQVSGIDSVYTVAVFRRISV
ncbi:hypothetical protein KAR91_34395 [Candidatus Pacearchaeota archaeon]|nr:hypothetical protein [Candidatus Pacearchaeota archaeon]